MCQAHTFDSAGISELDSGAETRKAAPFYRQRLANGGTLPMARLAYLCRERGEPWGRIARKVGYVSTRAAWKMAPRYAQRAGLPWPVPLRDAPSAIARSGSKRRVRSLLTTR